MHVKVGVGFYKPIYIRVERERCSLLFFDNINTNFVHKKSLDKSHQGSFIF